MDTQCIRDFIRIFEEEEGLRLCIHDYSGFLMADPQLLDAVRPWLAHGCTYCMAVKSDPRQFRRCQDMKALIVRRLERQPEGFFGTCHAGVSEWVSPVWCGEVLAGTLLLGTFRKPGSERRVRRVEKLMEKDGEMLIRHHRQLPESGSQNWERITRKLGLLSMVLADTYQQLVRTHQKQAGASPARLADERILHALGFIESHYMHEITVQSLSEVCHCSESTMNHLFKRVMKVNVRFYINKVRTEHAKSALREQPQMAVTDIAIACGFSDPNYFSSVFAKITGLTPTEYRRRFRSAGSSGRK